MVTSPDGRFRLFVLGALLTLALIVRKVPGAILILDHRHDGRRRGHRRGGGLPEGAWGLTTPAWPGNPVSAPDFGLLGEVSLFGGFGKVGVLTGILCRLHRAAVLLLRRDGHDPGRRRRGEADGPGDGNFPGINKVLFVDGVAVAAGGASSSSATTCFVESTAGVGEGARTGLGERRDRSALLGGAVPHTAGDHGPVEAATPALLAVGFLIIAGSVRDIDWSDYTLAVPAFLAMVMMPFTYSITNGIGIGFIAFSVLRLAAGRGREVPVAMYVVSAVFVFYYAMPALGLT
ncbi:MFS transporter, AGZA family, xanthine/uracil permease OS=Streptomyces microflavus OX=1919 GN=Smic_45590 PE=3 SV=1 [Streptomyces microflavus]